MPKLDGKKYPYTKAGKEQHKKDKAKKSGLTAKQKTLPKEIQTKIMAAKDKPKQRTNSGMRKYRI